MENQKNSRLSAHAWDVQLVSAPHDKLLDRIAEIHLKVLKKSASAAAGSEAIKQLYCGVIQSQGGIVIFSSKGGFASGAVCLPQTEKSVRRSLSLKNKMKLLLRHLIQPQHFLAQMKWKKILSHKKYGYILTLGKYESPDTNGLGKFLLSELEAHFLRSNCNESWVDTEKSNDGALRFYVRNGYILVREDFQQCLLRKSLK